jgi:chloramphenicol 3-O phosphotransferase
LEVLEQRERGRKDRTLGQARAQFPLVHARALYDLEVDTSVLSPLQCAEQIKDMLVNRIPPIAFKRLKKSYE